MNETFWQKIKQNRFFPLILCFSVLAVLAILFFAIKNNLWIWLIVLLCPLMHFFMMKGHHNHGNHPNKQGGEENGQKKIYKCPECGLEYEEKSWAEKCEKWCKEHHTCNLEIIKHVKVEGNKNK